ncbi:MAG: hypothetical protein COB02_18535 [Candidatus Cloacimonadota bacterium]|nr:MAG: hypothetical protein COB02_18535 [Candidatus Cloacimonadota bacterium]
MKVILLTLYILLINLIHSNPKRIFKQYADAVVKIELLKNDKAMFDGTGFFVGKNGIILTNHHVVEKGLTSKYKLRVRLKNGEIFEDVEIGQCSDIRDIDLCLLKIKYKPKRYVKNSRKSYEIGEKVYIIGHPRGLEWSITDGILSGERKIKRGEIAKYETQITERYIDSIQISAPVNPGNSGGPIFDRRGKLLGVTTWRMVRKSAQNLNFGVNSIEALSFFNLYFPAISETHLARLNKKTKKYVKSTAKTKTNLSYKIKKLFKINLNLKRKIILDSNGYKRYEGEVLDGKYHGEGVLYYRGVMIKGNFQHGKIYYGIVFRGKNKEYEGGLGSSHEYEGKGKLYSPDGNLVFSGVFKSGKLNNFGRVNLVKNNQLIYRGDFSNNQFEGYGKYYYQNGKIAYEGRFLGGIYSGHGTSYNKDGSIKNTGHFYKGIFQR